MDRLNLLRIESGIAEQAMLDMITALESLYGVSVAHIDLVTSQDVTSALPKTVAVRLEVRVR